MSRRRRIIDRRRIRRAFEQRTQGELLQQVQGELSRQMDQASAIAGIVAQGKRTYQDGLAAMERLRKGGR